MFIYICIVGVVGACLFVVFFFFVYYSLLLLVVCLFVCLFVQWGVQCIFLQDVVRFPCCNESCMFVGINMNIVCHAAEECNDVSKCAGEVF